MSALRSTTVPTRSDFRIWQLIPTRWHDLLKELSFPDVLDVGIGLDKLGTASVVYRLGIFRAGEPEAAAMGRFVHVYVDTKTRAVTEVPVPIRAALARL